MPQPENSKITKFVLFQLKAIYFDNFAFFSPTKPYFQFARIQRKCFSIEWEINNKKTKKTRQHCSAGKWIVFNFRTLSFYYYSRLVLITVITMREYHFHKANYMKQKSIVIASCLVANFPQAHGGENGRKKREVNENGWANERASETDARENAKQREIWNLIEFLKSMSKTMNSYCYWAVAHLRGEMTMMLNKNKLISIGIICKRKHRKRKCV